MKRLYRSRKNKMIFGICGGLGDYFRIDPFLFRIVLIFLCIFTAIFPLVLAYCIACFIIPIQPKDHVVVSYKRLYRSKKDRKIAGVCGGIGELFHFDTTLIRIGFIVLFFITGFFPLLFAYIIGWIIIPEKPPKQDSIEIEIP